MSHSFVEHIVHIMWSTENQQFHLSSSIRNELYAYITTLTKIKSGKIFACGGNTDHIHLLVLLPTNISLASFINFIKSSSSKWIKHRDPSNSNFKWQIGYFAASVQNDRIHHVSQYIQTDESRHISQNSSYRSELLTFLKHQNIPFQEQYLLTNSFSKMKLHVVWSTHNRSADLIREIRSSLYEQISKIISDCNSTILSIGGIEDHVHLLVEVSRNTVLSDMIRDVKTHATHWLKRTFPTFKNFEWQTGFGAFSVNISGINGVKQYIETQEERHKVKSFTDEWNDFLLKAQISSKK